MKVWLAIDADGLAQLFDKKPFWEDTTWEMNGDYVFPWTGSLPPIAAGECREVELEISATAPRLPERASTKTGRRG